MIFFLNTFYVCNNPTSFLNKLFFNTYVIKQTPLHLAVITKNEPITQKLLLRGANPCLLDRHGQTSVHLAVHHKTKECLETILTDSLTDIDLDIKNYEGKFTIKK